MSTSTIFTERIHELLPDVLADTVQEITRWQDHQSSTEQFITNICRLIREEPNILTDFHLAYDILPAGYRAEWSSFSPDEKPTALALFNEHKTSCTIYSLKDPPDALIVHGLSSEDVKDAIVNNRDFTFGTLEALCPSAASSLMVLIQYVLDTQNWGHSKRSRCHKTVRQLINLYNVLPPSFHLHEVSVASQHPIAGGGYADIYLGSLTGQTVCLKVLRIFQQSSPSQKQAVDRAFCNEAFIWRQLHHPNILPFFGVTRDAFPGRLSLVSPYLKRGNVTEFLKANPTYNRVKCIHEIASGMEYLHSLSICHGDIKGANILVHDDGHCRLADFGIAALIHTHSNTFSTTLGDGSTQMHGSARWAAPEILEGHSKEHTSAQDVYAFACTITEIATGQPPFASEHFTDASVLLAVVQGKRPSRPDVQWLTDDIWGLVQECWAHDPHERPRVSRIIMRLGPALQRQNGIHTTHGPTRSLPSVPLPSSLPFDSSKPRLMDVVVTTDTLNYHRIDISNAISGDDIRHRVITQVKELRSYDDGEFSILQTTWGGDVAGDPLGDALEDEELWTLCRFARTGASIVLLVLHSPTPASRRERARERDNGHAGRRIPRSPSESSLRPPRYSQIEQSLERQHPVPSETLESDCPNLRVPGHRASSSVPDAPSVTSMVASIVTNATSPPRPPPLRTGDIATASPGPTPVSARPPRPLPQVPTSASSPHSSPPVDSPLPSLVTPIEILSSPSSDEESRVPPLFPPLAQAQETQSLSPTDVRRLGGSNPGGLRRGSSANVDISHTLARQRDAPTLSSLHRTKSSGALNPKKRNIPIASGSLQQHPPVPSRPTITIPSPTTSRTTTATATSALHARYPYSLPFAPKSTASPGLTSPSTSSGHGGGLRLNLATLAPTGTTTAFASASNPTLSPPRSAVGSRGNLTLNTQLHPPRRPGPNSGSPGGRSPTSRQLNGHHGSGSGSGGRSSTDNSSTWAERPPIESVYENMQEHFPDHNVDEPIALDIPPPSPSSRENHNQVPRGEAGEKRASLRMVGQRHQQERRKRREPRRQLTRLEGEEVGEVTQESRRTGRKSQFKFPWYRGELIGKGAFASVYLALNASSGEVMAVKEVEIPHTESDRNNKLQLEMVKALRRESDSLKNLDHPNIIQYLGYHETVHKLTVFLEYVPGGSVGSCLSKYGAFSEPNTKHILRQILDGLSYLHSKRIMHRDIKSDNILLEQGGIIRITDFGLSKRIVAHEVNTAVQGTVFWMAPEVIRAQEGKGYDTKADIWSVGCILHEMWFNERPWSGDAYQLVLARMYTEDIVPPLPRNALPLSPSAENIRDLCFAFDPEHRPSAAELRNHPYLNLPPQWEFKSFP